MIRTLTFALISALLLSAAAPAIARGDRDQDHLREAAAQGQIIPLNRLIADVRSRAPYNEMTYLGGPQFDAGRMIESVPGTAADTSVANRIAALPKGTFSGLGVYHPSLFNGCADGIFKLAPLLRTAAVNGRVGVEVFEGDWRDIGTPERLAALNSRLRLA